MLYLQVSFGDPLLFVHVQSQFGAGRETSVILFPQTLWRGLKIVVLVAPGLKWWSYLQDLFFTVLALSALVVGLVQSRELRHKSPLWLRRCCYWLPALPLSWYIFSLAALLLPTATGTLSSMPRYVLVAIPVFAILASAPLPKWGRAVLLIVSSCLLLFNAVLYIQGYWVA